jgi:acyl dehydratase
MSNELEYLKTLKAGDTLKGEVDVGNGKPKDSKKYRKVIEVKTFKVIEREGELWASHFQLLPGNKFNSWEFKMPK